MRLLLELTITTLLFAIGLEARAADLVYLWRRPLLLAKSLCAMYLVVPAVAVLMALTLPLPASTDLALVILAICAGAPLLPKKVLRVGGDPTYLFSLVVTTSLLSIVTIPAGVKVVGRFVSLESSVTSSAVAVTVLGRVVLPLAIGMGIRVLLPGSAARVGDVLLRAAGVGLGICSLVLLATRWRILLEVGWPSFLAFAIFTGAATVTGHLMGGPEPSGRTSLAIACASRHVALALLVAASYRGPRALTLVAGYLVATALVSLPYLRWRSRVHDRVD